MPDRRDNILLTVLRQVIHVLNPEEAKKVQNPGIFHIFLC